MALSRRRQPLAVDKANATTLVDLNPGQAAEVIAVTTQNSTRLMKLATLGIVPGCTVRLQQRCPTYVIWVGETLLSLAEEIASDIVVCAHR